MKKTLVCLALAALALVPAVQAGESKGSAANKASSAEKAKASVQKSAPGAKAGCCEKSACGSTEKFTRKTVKPAEKGATLLARK